MRLIDAEALFETIEQHHYRLSSYKTNSTDYGMNKKYEDLANAIVLTAVKDYRAALRKLNKHPRNQAALNTKEEVERFFHSGWYRLLTSLDPDMLIKQLNEENVHFGD